MHDDSLVDGPPPQDHRPQGHRYQDRSIHEHRCGHDEAHRARCVHFVSPCLCAASAQGPGLWTPRALGARYDICVVNPIGASASYDSIRLSRMWTADVHRSRRVSGFTMLLVRMTVRRRWPAHRVEARRPSFSTHTLTLRVFFPSFIFTFFLPSRNLTLTPPQTPRRSLRPQRRRRSRPRPRQLRAVPQRHAEPRQQYHDGQDI